jgi:putative proteasome-type protease
MTYCVGLLLNEGLVFASDTRTNAGVDQVAIVPKMHIFEVKNKRVVVLLTAGNLAITQSVVNALKANTLKKGKTKHINNVSSMFDVAELVGEEMRLAYERDAKHLKSQNIEFKLEENIPLATADTVFAFDILSN